MNVTEKEKTKEDMKDFIKILKNLSPKGKERAMWVIDTIQMCEAHEAQKGGPTPE